MPRTRHLIPTAALLTTITSLLLTTPTATAMSGSGRKTVHRGLTYCVQASASIDHRTGPFSGNYGYATAYLVGIDLNGNCTLPADGTGRISLKVQFHNGTTWQFCRASDTIPGPFGWTTSEFPGPTGPSTLLDYGGAVCGPAHYRTLATAEYQTPNGWVGGTVASPSEWVE